MPVRVLSIVHQRDAGSGVFGEVGGRLEQWVPAERPPPALAGHDAVMVFGGAMHADQDARHPWLAAERALLREALERRVPTLGVCLGAQLVAAAAGAAPRRAREPEIGWRAVELTDEGRADPLLGGLPPRFEAFQWHSYEAPPPTGAVVLAHSPVCLQAYRLDGAPAWGIQFHAEVTERSVGEWLDDYRSDEDAVAIGLDPDVVRAATRPRIAAWNELGRGIAKRFLALAQSGVR